jgi:hypothetical protein
MSLADEVGTTCFLDLLLWLLLLLHGRGELSVVPAVADVVCLDAVQVRKTALER